MQKRLTITMQEDLYNRLYEVAGERHISNFIETVLRPYLIKENEIENAYLEMARDEKRENEALDWSEALIGDVSHETR